MPKTMGLMDEVKTGVDLFAKFETTEGIIVCRLFSKDAPKTVENFVGLATGDKPWVDPITGEDKTHTPLYDGTIFHLTIKDFRIQGGDPSGRGSGGPGFKFDDEFQSGRKFDKPGLLAMANLGPNTNGSQFFITVVPTSWLTGKHTIFGEVVSGQEVVDRIANVIPKTPADKPRFDVVIKKLTIAKTP